MTMGKYKRKYLWVDEDFFNTIMENSKNLKKNGFETGSADLTRRLNPLIKENVDFAKMFPKTVWIKKKVKKEV